MNFARDRAEFGGRVRLVPIENSYDRTWDAHALEDLARVGVFEACSEPDLPSEALFIQPRGFCSAKFGIASEHYGNLSWRERVFYSKKIVSGMAQ